MDFDWVRGVALVRDIVHGFIRGWAHIFGMVWKEKEMTMEPWMTHIAEMVTDDHQVILRLCQWNLLLTLGLIVSVYLLWERSKPK